MCGFVGYILSGHTSRPEPARWSEVIRHRGPDQGGHVADGEFGIGTRRLAILDLSETGSQPMRGERYTLGFNGEIYNHMEIRAALEGEAPVAWRSRSDTETVLRAVERWGVSAALARLNGMYALALFDAHERALTLARDPLGIKPLLYLERPDGILFASELKALRPYSAGRISADGMALYLLFGFVPAPFSLLADVQKLLPGEVLRICQGARRRHFVQPLAWDTAPSPLPTITERMAQLRAEVSAAVSRQLLSDVPVGFFLSGGVDSTIVAAVAARIASGLTSFSIRPEGAAADPGAQVDADLAASFAHDHGFAHHEISLRPEILTDDLASLIDLLDEPTAELYFAAEVLLSRRARAAGVAVVLTGHGGDEVFLGYPSYSAQIKGERYDGIPFFGPALRTLATLPIVPRDARDNMRGAAEIWRRPFLECYA
ncbi:MAG: asparagine synthase (glutamine-hydrolyzing), partial [Oscillochloris sp.]|nr:asparagine synthase (glutamine-hydrolyzing) [Oscillochloris sp.]